MSTATSPRTGPTDAATGRNPLFSALIGLASLAVLLQGLWAGLFLRGDDRDVYEGWIEVHNAGAITAIVLALAATVVAFVKLRGRRDLWIGSGVLTLLLGLEAFLGGLIADQGKDGLTAVHVPLAMALMGLVVWLPLRSRGRA